MAQDLPRINSRKEDDDINGLKPRIRKRPLRFPSSKMVVIREKLREETDFMVMDYLKTFEHNRPF